MDKEIRLQIGMRVVIKDDKINFQYSASKTKTITNLLPDFGKSRAFGLDGDSGIWCIEDFQYCVEYPDFKMI